MKQDNNTRKIKIILFLIILLSGIATYHVLSNKEDNSQELKIKQLYTSDYNLHKIGAYFYGGVGDTINVIIDKSGKELYLEDNGITYDKLYESVNGNIIILKKIKNKILISQFNGQTFEDLYMVDGNIKKIVCDNYLIGLIKKEKEKTYIYNLKSNKPIKLENKNIIAKEENDVYYIDFDNALIVKNIDNKQELIDLKGNKIIDKDYDNIEIINKDLYILTIGDTKYLSNKQKIILKSNYINFTSDCYISIKNNKMNVYDKKMKKINKTPILVNKNSIDNCKKIENNILVAIDNKSYIIHEKGDYDLMDYDEYSFDNPIYTRYKNKINIYDKNMIIKNNLSTTNTSGITNVSIVENGIVRVVYNNKKIEYFDKHNKKINHNNNLLFKNNEFILYLDKKELLFINYNGKELYRTKGSLNYIDGDNIIIDKNLYKISME